MFTCQMLPFQDGPGLSNGSRPIVANCLHLDSWVPTGHMVVATRTDLSILAATKAFFPH